MLMPATFMLRLSVCFSACVCACACACAAMYVRRLERNEARREEVNNLEYLKNVMIKVGHASPLLAFLYV